MYCGDETGGVVVDVGAHTTKMGYAGDDMPKSVFSGRVGVIKAATEEGAARASTLATPKPRYVVGPTASTFRPGMELKPATDYGLYEDWDMMEALWQYGFSSMHCDTKEHPVVLSDPPSSVMAQREKIAELMFETFDVPALYLARQPMLAAFSTGRSSGIVVDLGHSCTRVTPIYDGYVISKGLHMSEVGGANLNVALHELLQKEHEKAGAGGGAGAGAGGSGGGKLEVLPRYAFSKAPAGAGAGAGAGGMDVDDAGGGASYTTGGGRWRVTRKNLAGVTTSYHTQATLDVYDDMKRSVCEVAELGWDPAAAPVQKTYELPDGNVISVGTPRQLVPELLFRPDLIESWGLSVASRTTANWTTQYNTGVIMRQAQTNLPVSLQQMIYSALLTCTPETRRELCGHVILTGGSSQFKDLHKRLHWEMLVLVPAAFKPRIVAPPPLEREYANWIGGSVLASLGTFQQAWISRAEYDEEGPSVVDKRVV